MLFLHRFLTRFLTRFWTDIGAIFGPFAHHFPTFVRLCFLIVFRGMFFVVFGALLCPKWVPKGGPESVQNQLEIELGAETPFGPILDPIWGRFWDHLGTILGRFRRSKLNSYRKQRASVRINVPENIEQLGLKIK